MKKPIHNLPDEDEFEQDPAQAYLEILSSEPYKAKRRKAMKKFILTILVLASLTAMSALAWAKPRQKFTDEKVKYFFPVKEDNSLYLTLDMPRKVFLTPQWRSSGHPGARDGWGAWFIHVSHPRARGTQAHYHVELRVATGPLGEWASSYHTELAEVTLNGMMTIIDKPGSLKAVRVKLGNKRIAGYRCYYRAKASNAIGTAHIGNCTVWIFDLGEQRIVVTAESLVPDGNASSTLLDALGISVKGPSKPPHFKVVDQTRNVYRYLSYDPPRGWEQDFGDEHSGHFGLWIKRNGEKIESVIELRGIFLGSINADNEEALAAYVDGAKEALENKYGEVGDKRTCSIGKKKGLRLDWIDATTGKFNENKEKTRVRQAYFKDGAGFMWMWRMQTFINDLEEVDAAKRIGAHEKSFIKMLRSVAVWWAE